MKRIFLLIFTAPLHVPLAPLQTTDSSPKCRAGVPATHPYFATSQKTTIFWDGSAGSPGDHANPPPVLPVLFIARRNLARQRSRRGLALIPLPIAPIGINGEAPPPTKPRGTRSNGINPVFSGANCLNLCHFDKGYPKASPCFPCPI